MAPPAWAFGFDDVAAQAEKQARKAYQPLNRKPPAELAALTYDQYRDIRFSPDHALWRPEKLPFEVMFFHIGKFQVDPVRINEVTPKGVRHIPYEERRLQLRQEQTVAAELGRSRLRRFPRALPAEQRRVQGRAGRLPRRELLPRARHRDCATACPRAASASIRSGGNGEEFPRFTEFWMVRPDADARVLTVYALLDSPRVSGAYQFDIHPGDESVMDVRMRMFLRGEVATLGIAPLTSMFAFGENQPHRTDFRPEVHDSDGLMIATGGGEWIWRPLVNPRQTLTTSFSMQSLKGFGLMQRDRNFHSYEDSEARYELRPSAWVEPVGDWGTGRVELFQLQHAR